MSLAGLSSRPWCRGVMWMVMAVPVAKGLFLTMARFPNSTPPD